MNLPQEHDGASPFLMPLPPYLRTQLQGEYTEYLHHWPAIAEEQRRQEYAGPPESAPRLSIVMPVYRPDPLFLHAAIHSVVEQHYPHWELLLVLDGPQPNDVEHVADDAAAMDSHTTIIRLPDHSGISVTTNAGVHSARSEYIGFLDHDDLLEPTALGIIASTIARSAYLPDLLYTDHDKIDTEGHRYDPEFKPDWSPETLLSHCYIGHFKVLRKTTFLALDGLRKEYDGAQDYDLLLRLAERTTNVLHIPHILYHWRNIPLSIAVSASTMSASIDCGMHALQAALTRRKKHARAFRPHFSHQCNIGVYGLRFNGEDFSERVTIIVPTKDRPDLLEPCLQSIRSHTTYQHYNILVINNGTDDRNLARLLQEHGAQRLDIPTEECNFSHLLNCAVEQVQTPFVLFLNDDTEVISGDWLLTMLGTITLSDHIGAVGAKLLFPGGDVQHSGVVLGPNDITAEHAHRHLPRDDPGYRNANRALRNFSAITAACMLTKTALFRDVGGFDEQRFPIAYNDVDYCLKILAKGFRTVCAPDALLLHHQAATRGKTFHSDTEYISRTALRRAWFPLLRSDPYYNPHLSRHDERFHLRTHPHGRRVLFVSHNLAYEGASLSLLDLAVALKKRKYHVEVISPKPGPLAHIYEQQNIPLHIKKEGEPNPLILLHRNTFDILFLNTIATYELLQNNDICAHPVVWCIRESERAQYTHALPDLSPTLFSAASRVLFVANATREVYGDLDRGHFRTIHTGIDIAQIDSASEHTDRTMVRSTLGIADTDIVITVMGTICQRKGQKELVEAAIELLRSSPFLHFLIVGGGTESVYEEELQKCIRHSGFHKHIHLIDKTPDVDQFYAASDIFVCNSSIESFPRVILEAMAWKLPIVATNTFGIPEQIRDGVEGLLIPPGHPETLLHALHQLLENTTLRNTLTHNARARVEEYFGLDRMVDQYEKLFRELCPASLRV